jgi:uncharacterized protein (DUF3084 family)
MATDTNKSTSKSKNKSTGTSKEQTFNSPILVPILDLALAAALAVAGGALWFHSNGMAAIEASLEALQQERAANLAELRQSQESLTAAEAEAHRLQAERDRQAEYDRFLMDRIQQEQQSLTTAWEEQRPLVETAQRLQAEIENLRDRARAYRTDVIETDWRIDNKRSEVSSLQLQVEERRQALESAAPQPAQARGIPPAAAPVDPLRPALTASAR